MSKESITETISMTTGVTYETRLRDEYAGIAMSATIRAQAARGANVLFVREIAFRAIEIADAMIKERRKRDDG